MKVFKNVLSLCVFASVLTLGACGKKDDNNNGPAVSGTKKEDVQTGLVSSGIDSRLYGTWDVPAEKFEIKYSTGEIKFKATLDIVPGKIGVLLKCAIGTDVLTADVYATADISSDLIKTRAPAKTESKQGDKTCTATIEAFSEIYYSITDDNTLVLRKNKNSTSKAETVELRRSR